MFDAAGVAVSAEVAAEAVAQQQAEQNVDGLGDSNQTSDPPAQSKPGATPGTEPSDLLEVIGTVDPPAGRREIVFVDSAVEDYQTLLDGIDTSAQVVMLDADRDGVEQIAEVLAQFNDVDAVHIIAHGDAARLELGN